MGFEDHKSDYVMRFPGGQKWQIGSRRGTARQASARRWLQYERMNWKRSEWQVGHISFR